MHGSGEAAARKQAARRVLARYAGWEDATIQALDGGLINHTYRVTAPGREPAVLQCLHPIFEAELHLDIVAVTARLKAAGLPTPELLESQQGRPWVVDGAHIWRLQTWLPGQSLERVDGPHMAREAGALLGRFHRALWDCEHRFHVERLAHDLPGHCATLRAALEAHVGHRLFGELAPLANALITTAEGLPELSALPARCTHGDPKISNMLFVEGGAHALVDLDTLGRLDLPTELGDALRSWCNPAGEDAGGSRLELPLFEAALAGYADATDGGVTAPEWECFVTGLERICVELAIRFAADAVNERYFGWNPALHPGRGEHNLQRARGQWQLAQSVQAQRAPAEAALRRIFS